MADEPLPVAKGDNAGDPPVAAAHRTGHLGPEALLGRLQVFGVDGKDPGDPVGPDSWLSPTATFSSGLRGVSGQRTAGGRKLIGGLLAGVCHQTRSIYRLRNIVAAVIPHASLTLPLPERGLLESMERKPLRGFPGRERRARLGRTLLPGLDAARARVVPPPRLAAAAVLQGLVAACALHEEDHVLDRVRSPGHLVGAGEEFDATQNSGHNRLETTRSHPLGDLDHDPGRPSRLLSHQHRSGGHPVQFLAGAGGAHFTAAGGHPAPPPAALCAKRIKGRTGSGRPQGHPWGPPQIRTCRFPASGSSKHGFATRKPR
jgi:hypothetical protein